MQRHTLAKVGVEGSNPFARSKYFKDIRTTKMAIRAVFACLRPESDWVVGKRTFRHFRWARGSWLALKEMGSAAMAHERQGRMQPKDRTSSLLPGTGKAIQILPTRIGVIMVRQKRSNSQETPSCRMPPTWTKHWPRSECVPHNSLAPRLFGDARLMSHVKTLLLAADGCSSGWTAFSAPARLS